MDDEVIWIEILARQRETVARQRANGPLIAIGRAYDNDIVLDDPHVAAHHLRLSRGEDGRWIAEDLGTLNGLRVAGARRDRVVLDGDTIVQIGRTDIRLRSCAYAVPPELPLLRTRPRWPAALVCLIAMLGVSLLQSWLGETGESKLVSYLTALLVLAIMTVAWASVWSVISRIFTGYAQYGRHLFIASAGLLVYTIYDLLTDVGAFALSLPVLMTYGFVGAWLVFAIVCFAHLRALGPTRLVLKAVCVLLLAGMGVALQGLKMSDGRSSSGQPTIAVLQKLQPPASRLVSPQTQSAFFAGAASLEASLDKARTEELPSGSDNDDD
ncbi:MAG: FHA domain-containing protein [Rhodanobacter sp.]|jgi:hypothetical protein|nr:FHA domain-containing protein [Rhodanobacter sp.]